MSEQNAQMTYQDAEATLISEVFTPVFFDKLANDFGIRPTNEDEAREMLVLAGKLEHLYEVQQTKEASKRASVVHAASKSLDEVLKQAGINTYEAEDNEVKEAASQLSQVQHLRDAALLYQDAQQQLAK